MFFAIFRYYSNTCTIICILSLCIIYCDAQCNCTLPTATFCNTGSMTCVQCLEDSNCVSLYPTKPHCKEEDFSCVECVQSSDCTSSSLPACNKNKCAECVDGNT